MTDLRLVYITASNRDEAMTLSHALVEQHLVACVNIIDTMTSVYWWDGAPQEEQETVLLIKTRADRVEALTEAVRALHSYEIPCVISMPIAGDEGNPDFLTWIRNEASPQ